MKFDLCSTVVLICLSMTCASARADWESSILPRDFDTANSLDKAVALAKQKNKAVIVYYTRTNCPPCNVLQSRLRKEEVAAPFRDSYVFTAVWGTSMGQSERETYRSRFGVQGAPTWLIFSQNGEYVCTSAGGFFTDEGGKKLHEAIQSRLSIAASTKETASRRCVNGSS